MLAGEISFLWRAGKLPKVTVVIVSFEALFNAAISADIKRILPGEGLDFVLVDGCQKVSWILYFSFLHRRELQHVLYARKYSRN